MPSCVVCESKLIQQVWRSSDYRILACRKCGLEFADPMKSAGSEWYSTSALYEEAKLVIPHRWEWEQFRLVRPPGKTLLDIGCGRGDFALQAFDLGYRVCGIDLQARMVNVARQRLPTANFQVLNIQTEPLPRPFDIITAFEIIEHLECSLDALMSIRAALEPGGHLVLSVPCIERRPFFKRLAVIDFPPHHLTMWTREAITLLLRTAGFRVVHLVKKGFELGDFQLLLEDAFSLENRRVRRLAELSCRMLEPVLRRWPGAGGCTIFAVAARTSAIPPSPS